MLNPLNTSKVYLRSYILVWIVVTAVHTLFIYFFGELDFVLAVTESSIFNILFAFVGFGIWYVVRFTRLEGARIFNTIITHLVAATFLVSVWLFAGRNVLSLIFKSEPGYIQFLSETVLWRGVIGLLYYTIVAFNYYLIQYYREYQAQKLKESEISRLLRETELSALKSQINPHFIFNSLNSVSSLTLTNPAKAHEMVINLSSFLRYMISPTSKQLIKLHEELNAVKLYLEIEQVRFGEKLVVNIDCAEKCQELLLPQLILQPLVENAIKYGVYESTGENSISITCSQKDGYLIVKVGNDMEAGGVPAKGQGIGLKNVKSRLELVYNNPDLIAVNKSESRFSVKLTFPQ